MDSLDRKAIQFLMRNGRATWADLGQLLGLSAPAAADRVHKLEAKGAIHAYAALADPEALGYPLMAFVLVTLAGPGQRASFLRAIEKMDQIAECHHVAGDGDYLLKVRCRGAKDLDRLLVEDLKEKLKVAHTRTTVVLATSKDSVVIPVAED